MKKISIVVAMTEDGVIGKNGAMPWNLSADLKNFKKITMGHAIIMGRKTFESIGKPLPGRKNIVLTTKPSSPKMDITVYSSIRSAIHAAHVHSDEAMVIGGGEIYKQFLPLADRIYLTAVAADVSGDTYFPDCDMNGWIPGEAEHFPADEKNSHPYCFVVLEKKT